MVFIKKNPNQYYINAGKLIKWPLNIQDRTILVPEDQLQEAKDNLTVQHLCNSEHRFHIQSVLPGSIELNKDEIKATFTPRIVHKPDEGIIGKEFKVTSDGAILQIVEHPNKDSVVMAYKNRPKANFNTTLAQVMKSCEIGVWKEIVNNN